MRALVLTACSLFLLSGPDAKRPSTDVDTILTNMLASEKALRTLSFKITNQERIGDQLLTGIQQVRMTCSPQKIYMQFVKPNKGAELIYVAGSNDDQATYRPNGFPYINLDLDPYGELMRKNNHHTIFKLGFHHIVRITNSLYNKHPQWFSVKDHINKTGIIYHRIVMENPEFHYRDYTVLTNENLYDIAEKLNISAYMVLQVNPELDSYNSVKPGQVLKVPSHYASRLELLVHPETYLPYIQVIHDDKGLYERYYFEHVEVNPVIPGRIFTSQYLGRKDLN